MEPLNTLLAVSPLDGRYWSKIKQLSQYFSEFALFRERLKVEIEYFIELTGVIPALSSFTKNPENVKKLRALYTRQNFTENEAIAIKKEEAITAHDVKAVEYYLKKKFDLFGFQTEKEFVHFALTSQDINNVSIPLLIKEALYSEYIPILESTVIEPLYKMAVQWMDVPMLAHTHGQPATPTRMGKELMVFVYRLRQQLKLLKLVPHSGKFGGATGQLNAHVVAYPQIDWLTFSDRFLSRLGLEREQWTTQISNYDNLAALQDNLRRINIILIDMCRDIWQYISLGYFGQTIRKDEVGSSAMPHKVNPIDFENAEGNFGIANAIYEFFSQKLPISRLQRDLTDSTVLRNIGVPMAHSIVAFQSISRGLGKLILNKQEISRHLIVENYVVVSEAIQTILRRESFPKPYEALKELTRTGNHLTKEIMDDFIDKLPHVNQKTKQELKHVTPDSFVGVVPSYKQLSNL